MEGLKHFCRNRKVDLIVVDEVCPFQAISSILHMVHNGILVTGLVAFYEHTFRRVPCELVGSRWLLHGDHYIRSPVARALKRLVDVLFASLGILITLSLWPAIAFFIKTSSPGPVFYKQERVGLDGRRFSMIKFRTMRADSESLGVPQWTEPNDNRVTAVGRLLRKTRFDEVPQFLNVLKGEMSCVGPRPERPQFVENFRSTIPYYDIRHQTKPGITGWAQIMYGYAAGDSDTTMKLSYDLYYVKNGTLLLDFEIMLKTMRAMMVGSR